jgi:hypothetical protein
VPRPADLGTRRQWPCNTSGTRGSALAVVGADAVDRPFADGDEESHALTRTVATIPATKEKRTTTGPA